MGPRQRRGWMLDVAGSMVEIGLNRAIGGVGFPELGTRTFRLSSGHNFQLVIGNCARAQRQMSELRYTLFVYSTFEFNRALQVLPANLMLADFNNAEQIVLSVGADHEIIQY